MSSFSAPLMALNNPTYCNSLYFSDCWKQCATSPTWVQTNPSAISLENNVNGCDCASVFNVRLTTTSRETANGPYSPGEPSPYQSVSVENDDDDELEVTFAYSSSRFCKVSYCVNSDNSVLDVRNGYCNPSDSVYSLWWAIFIGVLCFCFLLVCCTRRSAAFKKGQKSAVAEQPQRSEPMATACESHNAIPPPPPPALQMQQEDIPYATEVRNDDVEAGGKLIAV